MTTIKPKKTFWTHRVSGELVIDDTLADAARYMVALALEGHSKPQILQHVAAKFNPPTGRGWNLSHVAKLHYYPTELAAIVPDGELLAFLELRTSAERRQSPKIVSPLTGKGITVCNVCGGRLSSRRGRLYCRNHQEGRSDCGGISFDSRRAEEAALRVVAANLWRGENDALSDLRDAWAALLEPASRLAVLDQSRHAEREQLRDLIGRTFAHIGAERDEDGAIVFSFQFIGRDDYSFDLQDKAA